MVEAKREGANWVGMMSRRQPENRTGVEPAAEVAADRNVGAQANAHGLLQREAELLRPFCIGALRHGDVGARIVKVPVLVYLHVLVTAIR